MGLVGPTPPLRMLFVVSKLKFFVVDVKGRSEFVVVVFFCSYYPKKYFVCKLAPGRCTMDKKKHGEKKKNVSVN